MDASTRDEFFALVRELCPADLAKCFSSISKYADYRYALSEPVYNGPSREDPRFEIAQYPELLQWECGLRERSDGCVGRGRSLVLWGPTRTGKSTYARSLGEHIYFAGLFSGGSALSKSSSAKYAIFDDIRGGIKFFPGFKDWLGCQPCFMVKQLYREPILMEWGKPSIWISNTDPRDDMSEADIDWMEGNCDFICITKEEPIFRANTM